MIEIGIYDKTQRYCELLAHCEKVQIEYLGNEMNEVIIHLKDDYDKTGFFCRDGEFKQEITEEGLIISYKYMTTYSRLEINSLPLE